MMAEKHGCVYLKNILKVFEDQLNSYAYAKAYKKIQEMLSLLIKIHDSLKNVMPEEDKEHIQFMIGYFSEVAINAQIYCFERRRGRKGGRQD
jgi:hypothetical protein